MPYPPPGSSSQLFTGPPAILDGAVPELGIQDSTSALLPVHLPSTGTFAAKMLDTRTLEYEGPVALTADGGAFLPSQLVAAETANHVSGLRLVHGWIAGFEADLPCPLQPGGSTSGPQYGCGRAASLSDSGSQPVTGPSMTFRLPADGVQVQNRAYDDFAPAPESLGPQSKPEEATFLVRVVGPTPCASGEFCALEFAAGLWQIVARVDPWPDLAGIPTPAPTIAPSPGAPGAAAPVLPLTVDQLNAYMRMNSQSPDGRQLVITGTIVQKAPGMACTGSCTDWLLEGSDPTLYVKPVGDIGLGPWDQGGEPLTGTFAATMNEPYLLEYQGAVALGADGGPWLPSQLPSPANGPAQTDYWLVHGWIEGMVGAPSCPVDPAASPYQGPQYGCGPVAYLSNGAFQPWIGNEFNLPPSSIRVQNGAYRDFAPVFNPDQLIAPSEQATFLVRATYIPPCGPTEDCVVPAANYHWEIVARVGPWPVAALP